VTHELLDDCQVYEEESHSEFLLRYSGFGKDIYTIIQNELPSISKNIKLYRATKSTEKCTSDHRYLNHPYLEDSYGIYENGEKSFKIQLDPLSEVLIVSYFHVLFLETGPWSEDYYGEAITYIKDNFL
jgi:hypothetical protein